MGYAGALSGIAGVFLLACLSPGPVWVVVTSTSIAVSRRAGILSGLGAAAATLTWATLAMMGVGMFAQLAWLTIGIKLAGAIYLVWIGIRMILGARRSAVRAGSLAVGSHGGWIAWRRGYLASITNPKAAAFFGSVFVVMLPAHGPGWVYAVVPPLLAIVSAAWHCSLAVIFSATVIQTRYCRAKRRIDTAVGSIMVVLGVRLAVR